MSKDIALKDSPTTDITLMRLVEELEDCSKSRDNCEECPLEVECRRAFDSLADKKCHSKLTEDEYNRFKKIFNSLSKQMSF